MTYHHGSVLGFFLLFFWFVYFFNDLMSLSFFEEGITQKHDWALAGLTEVVPAPPLTITTHV